MTRLNITAVCYLNTIPFVFGIDRTSLKLGANLLLKTPTECTKNFINHSADIALIPAADTRLIGSDCRIITDYCIGADDYVRTVTLQSNSPIEKVKHIYLDSHSHTSVELVKILMREYWKQDVEYSILTDYSIVDPNREEGAAYLLIGDKVFDYESGFKYSYDLAHYWRELTSLPFVFAVWVAHKNIAQSDIDLLNSALKSGVESIHEAIKSSQYDYSDRNIEYLSKNIKFDLTSQRREALNRFITKIPPSSPI